MNKQWNKYMFSDKFVISDLKYVNSINDIYLSHFFIKESKHYFIDENTTEEILKEKIEEKCKVVLFNVSNHIFKEFIKENYETIDCYEDINIFSIEMTLIPIKEYKIAHKLCKIVTKYLNDKDIYYYATGGTKIGILRDKTLIPWDWDIDLVIMNTRENILNEDFLEYLCVNGIEIFKGIPLKKDFKLKFKESNINYYIDMLCLNNEIADKTLDKTKRYLCDSYYVKINHESNLMWNEWEEYIESAYFYCCLVYNYMGPTEYKKQGVKLYEKMTHENKFKIEDYKDYLSSVFSRYK